MSVSESHHTEAQQRLATVQAGLRRLDATVSTGGPDLAPGLVRGALAIALNDLDGAISLLSASGTIHRVACPFCGRMVMPAATRCGYCWRALGYAASG